MKYLPSVMQLTGICAVLCAIAVLVGPWVSVLAGGVILTGVGYVMESDR